MGIKEFQQERDDISSGSTVPKNQGDFLSGVQVSPAYTRGLTVGIT
jgi:hypothetical protein